MIRAPIRVFKNQDGGPAPDVVVKALSTLTEQVTVFKGEMTAQAKAALDATNSLGTRLDKLEAKGNRQGESSAPQFAPVVETITKAAGFEALKNGQQSTGRIAIPGGFQAIRKTLVSTQAGGSPNNGFDVAPQRSEIIGEDPRRVLRLLDALPHLTVTSNVLEYQSLNGYTNAADDQGGEGSTKAGANVPLTLQSAKIITIAHFLKASRQVLDDAPLLQRYLNSLLSYGVAAKLENLIVSGASPLSIVGLLSQATAFVPTATHAPDQISEAQASLDSAGFNASLVILNPFDWHRIRSERSTTGDGQYIAIGGWNTPGQPNIWGLPVVTTPSLASGNAIVLDPSGVSILDRQQVNVQMAFEGNDFTQNLITILAEMRAGFATFSNGAVLKFGLTF